MEFHSNLGGGGGLGFLGSVAGQGGIETKRMRAV